MRHLKVIRSVAGKSILNSCFIKSNLKLVYDEEMVDEKYIVSVIPVFEDIIIAVYYYLLFK